jgi:uncharacterized protein with FMN-binding domain
VVNGVARIALWCMSTLTVLVLLFGYSTSTSGPTATGGATVISTPVDGSTSSSGGAGTSGATTVTGPAVDTRWGPVQVEITVSGGVVTDVAVVEYPSENGRDRQINARALPILVSETLDAQSAGIDMVSGATVTSEGYVESLQAALDEAGL